LLFLVLVREVLEEVIADRQRDIGSGLIDEQRAGLLGFHGAPPKEAEARSSVRFRVQLRTWAARFSQADYPES
jgi:hypothetical protein